MSACPECGEEGDDPQWDGTDHAHPAWWRGLDRGVEGACMRVRQALAGDVGGVCQEPLQSIRREVVELVRLKAVVMATLDAWDATTDCEVQAAAHDLRAEIVWRMKELT